MRHQPEDSQRSMDHLLGTAYGDHRLIRLKILLFGTLKISMKPKM